MERSKKKKKSAHKANTEFGTVPILLLLAQKIPNFSPGTYAILVVYPAIVPPMVNDINELKTFSHNPIIFDIKSFKGIV